MQSQLRDAVTLFLIGCLMLALVGGFLAEGWLKSRDEARHKGR